MGIDASTISEAWRPAAGFTSVEVRLVPAEHHSRPMPHRPDDVCRRLAAPYAVPIHHHTLHPLGFHLAFLDWVDRPMRDVTEAVEQRRPRATVVPLAPMGPGWTHPGGP